MWRNKFKLLTTITITLCLVLSLNMLPVNAGSNQDKLDTSVKQLPEPPDGFNPATATDLELQQYGFPSRPSDLIALAQWNDVMSHAKHFVIPKEIQSTTSRGSVPPRKYTSNWAGYVVNGVNNNNATYTQATALWQQPTYSGSEDLSFWTGIGGFNGSQAVVQAGTDCDATEFLGTVRNMFWVDDAPNNLVYLTKPVVNPGDYLYVCVTYGGNTSTACLVNWSTDDYTIRTFDTLQYDGSSVEYIHEDANANYYPPYYDSWGSATINGCSYYGNQGGWYLADSNYREVWMSYMGQTPCPPAELVAHVSEVSPVSGFTVTAY